MTSETSEYKGHPILSLQGEGKFPFSFGIAKAKLILDHVEDIKKFVQEYGQEKEEND